MKYGFSEFSKDMKKIASASPVMLGRLLGKIITGRCELFLSCFTRKTYSEVSAAVEPPTRKAAVPDFSADCAAAVASPGFCGSSNRKWRAFSSAKRLRSSDSTLPNKPKVHQHKIYL